MGVAFVVIKFSSDSDSSYTAVIRSSISETTSDMSVSQNCDSWMSKFSRKTTTNWITMKTVPRSVRFLYKRVYSCQHSHSYKTKNLEIKRNSKSRDYNCKASIDIKVKKITADTRKWDKYLKLGLNTVIQVLKLMQ